MSAVSLHQHISALTLVVVFGCVGLALVQRSRCLVVIVGVWLCVFVWFSVDCLVVVVGCVWFWLCAGFCWFASVLTMFGCGCGFVLLCWFSASPTVIVALALFGCEFGFGCVGLISPGQKRLSGI